MRPMPGAFAEAEEPMRLLVIAAAILALGGCALGTAPPMAAAEGISTVGTGKTITDHVISFTSGKNCSTKRKNLGQTYCEEDEKNPPPNVYCYHSLGDVTCYERQDPYKDKRQRVGDNQNNLPGGF